MNEIDEANKAAMNTGAEELGPGPFAAVYDDGKWYPTNRFRKFVQSGSKFKWVLNQKGDLAVISPTLEHSVAAGGGDVWTAGHGTYTDGNTITLDNDTGHYETSKESLRLSKTAWESIGYNLNYKARQDFAALF